MKAITEYRYSEWSTKMRFIKAWKCSTCTTRPKYCCRQKPTQVIIIDLIQIIDITNMEKKPSIQWLLLFGWWIYTFSHRCRHHIDPHKILLDRILIVSTISNLRWNSSFFANGLLIRYTIVDAVEIPKPFEFSTQILWAQRLPIITEHLLLMVWIALVLHLFGSIYLFVLKCQLSHSSYYELHSAWMGKFNSIFTYRLIIIVAFE